MKKMQSKTYFCNLNSKTDTEHILKIYFISKTLPTFNNTFLYNHSVERKKKPRALIPTYVNTILWKT